MAPLLWKITEAGGNVASQTPSNPTAMKATSTAVAQALWPCAFYFVCSFAMNMLTKTLITSFQWHAIYALGAIQNIFTMLAVASYMLVSRCIHTAYSPATKNLTADTAPVPKKSHRQLLTTVLPLIMLHIGNMVFGFGAMKVVNMPMYLVLRRLTTIKVLLIEWIVLHKELATVIKLALLVSTSGSIIAGSTDATFEPWGYTLVILQNVCSAGSLTFSKESALPSQQIVLINSIAGSVVCVVLAILFDYEAITTFPYDRQLVLTMACMCCMCVLYQFAIMICTMKNSALATSVTGNVKDLASTVCGFVLFPDVQVRVSNVVGVSLSLLGAYLFSYFKFLSLTQTVAVASTSNGVNAAKRVDTRAAVVKTE